MARAPSPKGVNVSCPKREKPNNYTCKYEGTLNCGKKQCTNDMMPILVTLNKKKPRKTISNIRRCKYV